MKKLLTILGIVLLAACVLSLLFALLNLLVKIKKLTLAEAAELAKMSVKAFKKQYDNYSFN